MSTTRHLQDTTGVLSVPATLAALLDELDRRPRGADAMQYRAVAASLARELSHIDRDVLEPLLSVSPAAAEVYENLQYAHAGLCRSDLDKAMNAELLAKAVIGKAAGRSDGNVAPKS